MKRAMKRLGAQASRGRLETADGQGIYGNAFYSR